MILNNLLKAEKEVLNCIEESVTQKKKLRLTYLNQQCFNIYKSDSEYRKLLDSEFTTFLDGFGIFTALKILGYKNFQKFNATDLYYKIFQTFSDQKTKLFIIGGKFSENFIKEKAAVSNLNICGYENGYFNDDYLQNIIDKLVQKSPDVIVIGIGVPNQEIIAAKISESVPNKCILCVGGFLEFYFGTKKRAPKLLRNIGLEWLHRLFSEPKRLWKRYIIGIPVFIIHIVMLKFTFTKPAK